MIVSHEHKFIFIKTVKTAGTSIEIALCEICGPGDIITPISGKDEKIRSEMKIRGPQNTLVPFNKYRWDDWLFLLRKLRRVRYYNHVPARKIRQWIGKEIWDSYYKFCFERNPYDKVVSHYFWKGGEEKFGSISRYLTSWRRKKIEAWRQYTIDGELAVDKIYRFENIEEALLDLTDQLHLDNRITLPKVKTKSSSRKDKRHWREILTDEEKARIKALFDKSFKLMNYGPET